ncbi:MAG: efflux RND transporter periplasmic adaptor subunit [Lishizhenia sp.]
MKKNKITGLAIVALFVSACGGPSSTKSLDGLKEKKAKLKLEIAEIDDKIKALDTTTVTVFPLVELAAVQLKDFQHKITAQGAIETDKDALINAEMGGTIERIHVKEGDKVRQGQVLVTIDSDILASNIQEIKTQLEFAEYMLEKQEELKTRGVGSEFDYKQAKSQVDALNSKLKTLGTQKGKSVVRAPFSGVIDQIFPKAGEMAGAQAPLLRLVNNDKVTISADISERHYASIKEGTPIAVYVPTIKDTFMMHVTNVGNYINPTNRTFRIQTKLEKNTRLLPNMLAELNITDLNLSEVITVPSKSVLKSQQNEDYLFVASKSGDQYKVEKVIVEVLTKYNGETVVQALSGTLNKGDLVVTAGARGITEQDLVITKN